MSFQINLGAQILCSGKFGSSVWSSRKINLANWFLMSFPAEFAGTHTQSMEHKTELLIYSPTLHQQARKSDNPKECMIYEHFNWKCITRVVLVVPALWIVECSNSFFWVFQALVLFIQIFKFFYKVLTSGTLKRIILQFSVLHAMRCLELKKRLLFSRGKFRCSPTLKICC